MENNKEIRIEKQSGKYIFAKEDDFSRNNSITNSFSSTKHSESPGPAIEKDQKINILNISIKNEENSLICESKNDNSKCENQEFNHLEEETISTEENSSSFKTTTKISSYLEGDCHDDNEKLTDNCEHSEESIKKEKIEDNISTTKNKNENFKNANKISVGTSRKKNMTDEEKNVLEGLISFDRYNFKINHDKYVTVNTEEFFKKHEFKYISNTDDKTNEKYLFEKEVYETVENRIQKYYEFYKIHGIFHLDETEDENENFKLFTKKTYMFEDEDEKYHCIGFKGIVISIVNLISQWLVEDYLRPLLSNKKEFNLSFFHEILDKYYEIKNLCPHLKNDFELLIYSLQSKKHLRFCICELVTESFWDCVFRIHLINNAFVRNYKSKNLSHENKKSMQIIMNKISQFRNPYKYIVACTLNIYSIMYYYGFVSEVKRISEKNKSKNDENNSLNNNKITNTENYSLEEVYKYIQGDDGENKKKSNKQKKKKKKKKIENKENEEIVVQEEIDVDPIVEDFVKFLKDYNNEYQGYIKIKPVISKKWIDSLI